MDKAALDEFFRDAEDVLTDWSGSADSMNSGPVPDAPVVDSVRPIGPRRWIVVDPPAPPSGPDMRPWREFVHAALTDPDGPHYADRDWSLGHAIAKMLDTEIREWCAQRADPIGLRAVLFVPIDGWQYPYSEISIWGIPVRKMAGLAWPILGRELARS